MDKNGHGGIWFAAMNTANGFKSFFPDIFGALERLFIIKGGPGTGKSRLMKEIVSEAEKRGCVTERFLCSSDPSSLDGIMIPSLSLGVIDGTAPHTYEASFPGAKENIIDLGAFWDRKKLADNFEIIEGIGGAKKRLYGAIYGYLSVIRRFDDMTYSMAEAALDNEKLENAVKRTAYHLGNGSTAEHTVRIRSAISTDGVITLGTYARAAEKRFAVLDICGISGIFMKKLLAETDVRGLKAYVSYDPFFPEYPDAVYYPERDTAFYVGSEGDFEERTINMRRFVNDIKLRPYKPRIRAAGRLRASVLSELEHDAASVKNLHIELERIYSEAMDFSAKEKFTKELIKELFAVK